MEFQGIIVSINNAFFRIESYMSGTKNEYKYFGFIDNFTLLFIEAKKSENFTYENCKLIGEYWKLTEQIRVSYDKSDFDNTDAYENEMFCKDCEEIMYLNWERIEDFTAFSTPDEIERKFSITDILNTKALPPQQNKTKTDKLKAPVLGLFCGIINKIGIDKRVETESANIYCERICVKYKLLYTDRVRQNYNVNETKKLIQELTEKVLPLIDKETKKLIQEYLESKQPPKQNLYA
jgi:hypothetical protein